MPRPKSESLGLRKEDCHKKEVVSLKNGQPLNPYSEIQILSQHTDIVRLLIKIDHIRCASAGDDCAVIIWDIQSGCRLHTLQAHTRPVTSMCLLETSAYSYEDKTLLTVASDRLICAWDVASGVSLFRVTSHEGVMRSLVVLKEGELFCAGGENLSLWDKTGKLLCRYNREEAEDLQQMLVMNSQIIGAVDKQLAAYRIESGTSDASWHVKFTKRLSPSHREAIRSLVAVNESCFASGSLDGTIIVWKLSTLVPLHILNSIQEYEGENKMYPYSVQHMLSVEQRFIFAAVGSGFCVYDIETGQLKAERTPAHYSKILYLSFVYNGTFLVTCSEDGSVRLWTSSHTLTPLGKDDDTDMKIEESSWSIIERFLGKHKKELQTSLEGVSTPALVGECVAHSGPVQMCIDFSGEGFVSCGMDGLVIVWKDGNHENQRRNELIREILRISEPCGVV